LIDCDKCLGARNNRQRHSFVRERVFKAQQSPAIHKQLTHTQAIIEAVYRIAAR